MQTLTSYKDLVVWQKSMELAKQVYFVTKRFPASELYGLTSQMRRSAVSIASNIAEGYCRKNLGEYVQFLCIARASLAELETQTILSKDLFHSAKFDTIEGLIADLSRMFPVLIRNLSAKRGI